MYIKFFTFGLKMRGLQSWLEQYLFPVFVVAIGAPFCGMIDAKFFCVDIFLTQRPQNLNAHDKILYFLIETAYLLQ